MSPRLVRDGRNAIGVRLAGAWGTERFGFRENARLIYGDQPRFAAQLLLEYADGRSEWVTTDASWRASTGPITESGLYDGEHYDARRVLVDAEGVAFADAGYDESALERRRPSRTRSSCPRRGSRRSSVGSKSSPSSR